MCVSVCVLFVLFSFLLLFFLLPFPVAVVLLFGVQFNRLVFNIFFFSLGLFFRRASKGSLIAFQCLYLVVYPPFVLCLTITAAEVAVTAWQRCAVMVANDDDGVSLSRATICCCMVTLKMSYSFLSFHWNQPRLDGPPSAATANYHHCRFIHLTKYRANGMQFFILFPHLALETFTSFGYIIKCKHCVHERKSLICSHLVRIFNILLFEKQKKGP